MLIDWISPKNIKEIYRVKKKTAFHRVHFSISRENYFAGFKQRKPLSIMHSITKNREEIVHRMRDLNKIGAWYERRP